MTAARSEEEPTVAYVSSPLMLWLVVKSMERDLALGRANPESLSPPLEVATKDVALTMPLTVRPVSVPSLLVVTLFAASLSALTAPSRIFASVTASALRCEALTWSLAIFAVVICESAM